MPDPSQACPQWSDACGLVVLRWFTRSIRISRSWAPSVMMALPLRIPLSGYSILLWPLCHIPPASTGENQPVPDRTGDGYCRDGCVQALGWPGVSCRRYLHRMTSPKATSAKLAALPSLALNVRLWPMPGLCSPSRSFHEPELATVAVPNAAPFSATEIVAPAVALTPQTVAFARSSTMPSEHAPPHSASCWDADEGVPSTTSATASASGRGTGETDRRLDVGHAMPRDRAGRLSGSLGNSQLAAWSGYVEPHGPRCTSAAGTC